MKTLVIGCTGRVGSHVLKGLTDGGVEAICMTRSPEKLKTLPPGVEGRVADLDMPDSLSAAFRGIESAFMLFSTGPNETRQGLAAIQAAKIAGVRKVVYLSVYMPEGSTYIPHFGSKLPVENAVKETGMAWTILRPNNFFQNDLALRDTIMQYGVYPAPIGKLGLNRVDVRDIAECAVHALTRREFEGEAFAIHGPDILTGNDVARIYSRHVGRDVRYAGNDLDAWSERVKNTMPAWRVSDLRVMYKFFQDRGMTAPAEELELQQRLLGHKPRTFEDFVKEIAGSWKKELAKAA